MITLVNNSTLCVVSRYHECSCIHPYYLLKAEYSYQNLTYMFSSEKEKVYSRQYSAPILKRKTSRFGLGQLLGSMPSNNTIVLPGRHYLNDVKVNCVNNFNSAQLKTKSCFHCSKMHVNSML